MQLFFALLAALGNASTVTPVREVIQLMEGIIAKGKKEKHAEQVQYAAYKAWCDQAAIEEANGHAVSCSLLVGAPEVSRRNAPTCAAQGDLAAEGHAMSCSLLIWGSRGIREECPNLCFPG